MDSEKKFRLSFTGASLRLPEMSEMARLVVEDGWSNVTKEAVIKGGNNKTAGTQFREIKDRLQTMTNSQLEILAHGDLLSQKQRGEEILQRHFQHFEEA